MSTAKKRVVSVDEDPSEANLPVSQILEENGLLKDLLSSTRAMTSCRSFVETCQMASQHIIFILKLAYVPHDLEVRFFRIEPDLKAFTREWIFVKDGVWLKSAEQRLHRKTLAPPHSEELMVRTDCLTLPLWHHKQYLGRFEFTGKGLHDHVGPYRMHLTDIGRSVALAITNHNHVDRLQGFGKLKEDFLRQSTQELLLPLQSMMSAHETLQEGGLGPLNDAQKKLIDMSLAYGQRSYHELKNIIDYATLRNSDVTLDHRPVSLGDLMQSVQLGLQSVFDQKGIQLVQHIEAQLPLLWIDEHRSFQAILNVLTQALRFSKDGGKVFLSATHVVDADFDSGLATSPPAVVTGSTDGQVREQTQRVRGQAGWVKVVVEDDGETRPEEHYHLMLQGNSFQEVSIYKALSGPALVMSITRILVEAQGGHIQLERRKPKGTKLVLFLPCASQEQCRRFVEDDLNELEKHRQVKLLGDTVRASYSSMRTESRKELESEFAAALQEAKQPDPSHPATMSSQAYASAAAWDDINPKNGVILIVDDDPGVLALTTVQLNTDYCIVTAHSGQHALNLIEKGLRPDLVLCDVFMPGLSGYELCLALRRSFDASTLPILFLSSQTQLSNPFKKALQAGANDYLFKPVRKAELLARIEFQLKIKRLRLQSQQQQVRQVEIEKDLEAIEAVQQTLLPLDVPDQVLDVASYYLSAEKGGGDWYSCHFDRDKQRVFFAMADVLGHGASAAVVTGIICGGVQMFMQARVFGESQRSAPEDELAELSKYLNSSLYKASGREGRSATMCFACFDVGSGVFHWLNAGHRPPFRFNKNGVEALPQPSKPLGVEPDFYPRCESFALQANDCMLFYTDGLLENAGKGDSQIKFRHLQKNLPEWSTSAQTVRSGLVSEIQKRWKGRTRKDDCAFVVMRWKGVS